ncbi:T6SS effector BTH_I2691 family protein [Billgrantia lactosivorans]|uniref:T6SS effector BTH_I2691 family protein n=1 Tax=Billgrantia lactosivorans TaxID=2185141 RepID=UPI000DAED4B8|nr:T6SS effector BTH_I2691 family protein [Halomonas lactosivorans]
MSDRQAQQDARDAEFGETPFGATSMCPLYLECAIFPVRYAIDEASSEREEAQGPHPLAESWQRHGYPELHTRSYTLRQLRDGWLYVWDEIDRNFHEYRIEGHQFTRIPWPEDINETRPDEREGNGESKPYLLYPCRSRIWLAYSPAQWTWRICEHMRSNVDARRRFMRPLNIRSAIVDPENTAHVGPLNELGQHLADITPQGAVSDFDSTTVMTRTLTQEEQEGEEETEDVSLAHKPEIDQNAVLAQVPDKDQALFVALDDPLGIVDDLTMNLLGREMELEHFTDEHGHKLQTARVVQELCLVDIDDLVDEEVRHDPERYREAIVKTGELLDALASMDHGSDHTLVAREMQTRRLREELRELGMANPPGRNSPQYEAWHAKEHPRLDVKLDEVIDCLAEHGPRQERLQAHIENSLTDVIAWLERLPISAQELCFDTCSPIQSQAMLEFASLVIETLGMSSEGRVWLDGTFRERDSLIGLAMMNFDPAFAAAIDTISQNYILSGTADGEPTESGISASSTATLLNATVGVLKLESVQNSKAYQELAPHVKEALDTLREVVNGPSRKAWETIAYQFLPALRAGGQVSVEQAAKALSHSMWVVLVHPDLATSELVLDPEFEAKHRQWRAQDQLLARRIRDARRVSQRPGYSPHDRRSQLRNLEQLEQQRREHAYNEPKRVTAAMNEPGGHSFPGNQARADNLGSLGYRELREQHRLKLQGGARAARQHLKSGLERLGGGLALLIAGLNLYNFMDAVRTAQTEGVSEEELRNLGITAGYAAGAVMAIWVMPFWNRAAKEAFRLDGKMIRLADASINAWSKGNRASASRLAAKLATRAAGLAAIGAISAGLETWQIYQDYGRATSGIERSALMVKGLATFSMGVAAGVQLAGAIAGKWFAFGWIMASWATITLFTVGAIYLLASHIAARYNREGPRSWLYKSTWGKAGPEWPDTDEGRKDEWRNLMEVLLQPSVKLTNVADVEFDSSSSSYWGTGSITTTHQGFWVQLALPAALAGETVKVSELAGGGFWAPANSFEASLFQHGVNREALPAASRYEASDLRVWQAWIPASEQEEDASFTLTVDYSESLLSSPEGRSDFTFYKPRAASGKKEIEPNSEEGRGIRVPARLELMVPLTPEEQG